MAGLKSKYSVYVVFAGKKVKMPVNPEEVNIKYPTDHKTYNVIGVGEIVVPRIPSLKELSWESFFPGNRKAPYVNSGAKNVSFYVKKFEKALKSKKICRVIISRSGMQNTNVRCIISNFELIDKGGEPGDQYYKVDFKEYRSYDPEIVSITTVPSEDTGQTESGQTTAETGTDTTRPVDTPVLRVGASVTVNGEYCYDSNGGKPHGSANNLNTTVTRIVSGKAYPVHVGTYGWVQESQLQITG